MGVVFFMQAYAYRRWLDYWTPLRRRKQSATMLGVDIGYRTDSVAKKRRTSYFRSKLASQRVAEYVVRCIS